MAADQELNHPPTEPRTMESIMWAYERMTGRSVPPWQRRIMGEVNYPADNPPQQCNAQVNLVHFPPNQSPAYHVIVMLIRQGADICFTKSLTYSEEIRNKAPAIGLHIEVHGTLSLTYTDKTLTATWKSPAKQPVNYSVSSKQFLIGGPPIGPIVQDDT